MAYITKGQLERFELELGARAYQLKNRPHTLNEREKEANKKVIFLSHSHKDKDIVESVALFLLAQGSDVYVDWKDSSMPPTTSGITADNIKKRIKFCDEFIVIASNNALDSKWVPWELGFADATKKINNVFIFPIADNDGTWNGSEYFELYQKIELGRKEKETVLNEAVVKPAGNEFIAYSLKYVLKQNQDSTTYYVKRNT